MNDVHESRTAPDGTQPVYRLRARTQFLPLNGTLQLHLGERRAKIRPSNDLVITFLNLIAAGGTREQIHREFVKVHNDTGWLQIERILEHLIREGFIEQVNLPHNLPLEFLNRFERLTHFFSEFETDTQNRFDFLEQLRKARVGIVGLGGLASWVIYNLLCCGIEHLRVIDADVVELSNLNRSILFCEEDVGKPKVDVISRAARRFAPRVRVEGHQLFLSSSESLLPYIEDLDLVIGLADQPIWLVKQWITEACQRAKVPVIQAGSGQVGPFYIPGESSCIMCRWAQILERDPMFPEAMAVLRKLPRRITGSISPWAGMVASVLSMEVFRYLADYSQPVTINAIWTINGRDMSASLIPLSIHPACPVCTKGQLT